MIEKKSQRGLWSFCIFCQTRSELEKSVTMSMFDRKKNYTQRKWGNCGRCRNRMFINWIFKLPWEVTSSGHRVSLNNDLWSRASVFESWTVSRKKDFCRSSAGVSVEVVYKVCQPDLHYGRRITKCLTTLAIGLCCVHRDPHRGRRPALRSNNVTVVDTLHCLGPASQRKYSVSEKFWFI